MRPSRRVLVLTVVAVACGALIVVVALVGLAAPRTDLAELDQRVIAASAALDRARSEVRACQASFIVALTGAPGQRSATIADSQVASAASSRSWHDYLALAYNVPAERRLQRTYDRLGRRAQAAGAAVFGLADPPAPTPTERRLSTRAIVARQLATRSNGEPALLRGEDQEHTRHRTLALEYSYVDPHRVRRRARRRARQRDRAVPRRKARGARLPRTRSRAEALGTTIQPRRPSSNAGWRWSRRRNRRTASSARRSPSCDRENRSSCSSPTRRAHFRQVLSTDAEGQGPGCPVISPAECPAAASGQARVFLSSSRLDACPFLRSREGEPRSAACIPMSIAGTTTAVIHTTGPDGEPPETNEMIELELVARRPATASVSCECSRGARPKRASTCSPGSSTAAASRRRSVR